METYLLRTSGSKGEAPGRRAADQILSHLRSLTGSPEFLARQSRQALNQPFLYQDTLVQKGNDTDSYSYPNSQVFLVFTRKKRKDCKRQNIGSCITVHCQVPLGARHPAWLGDRRKYLVDSTCACLARILSRVMPVMPSNSDQQKMLGTIAPYRTRNPAFTIDTA